MRALVFCCTVIGQFLNTIANPVVGGSDAGKIVSRYGNLKEVIGHTEYPYIAYLDIVEAVSQNAAGAEEWIYFCGGAIIRSGAILTAAHCLTWTVTEPQIVIHAGILHKKIEEYKGQERDARDYLIHEDYIHSKYDDNGNLRIFEHNDIAIVWLKGFLEFNTKIRQIDVISPYTKIKDKLGFFLGWGRFDSSDRLSSMLQKGETRVKSKQFCADAFDELQLINGMICAISDNKTTTSCTGDSGGPFVIGNKLVGLVSFSCKNIVTLPDGSTELVCNPEKPIILTFVGKYQRWIEDNLHKGPPKYRDGNMTNEVPKQISKCKISNF